MIEEFQFYAGQRITIPDWGAKISTCDKRNSIECFDRRNKFDLSISGDVRGNIAFGSKKIFLLPVKKMLLEGMNLSDFPHALIYK